MSKRPADEPLENLVLSGIGSPHSKRAKVEDVVDEGYEHAAVHGHTSSRHADQAAQVKKEESPPVKEDYEEHEESEVEGEDGMVEDDDEDVGVDKAGRLSISNDEPPAEYSDLYLDTVNRLLLDFDFEKLCSVSLSNINVYACLICGRYYQGRGRSSHAYFHSLDDDHHVFINMATLHIYVLPESYEVKHKALEDIKYVVNPTYTRSDVNKLDVEPRETWDLGGRKYRPGFVGLNNIKDNDYLNVVVNALAHVAPLRNYMMLEDLSQRPELAQRFSILVRKLWNPKAFKSHVSPHELLQEVSLRSSKRFTLTTQSDPVEFLSWFLNNLHVSLGGSLKKPGSSIVQKVFQGTLRVDSQLITAKADASDRLRFEDAADVKSETQRFMMLTLDLPAAPLFQDEMDKNIIPQVPLTTILAKYDGSKSQELLGHRKRYKLLAPLPPYLIFHIKRFSKNKFVFERNPTIVTFPVRSLDMSPYVDGGTGEPVWYDLVANVTHQSTAVKGEQKGGRNATGDAGEEGHLYKVQLRDKSREEWVQVQDLFVEEIRKEILFLGESYIQIWEKRRDPPNKR